MFFFSHVSTSFNLLFLFFYFSSHCLTRFFQTHFRKPISTRSNGFEEDPHEENHLSDCSQEGNLGFFSSQCFEKEDLVADIILGGEALVFLPSRSSQDAPPLVEEGEDTEEEHEDHEENKFEDLSTVEQVSGPEYASESIIYEEENDEEEAQENDEEEPQEKLETKEADNIKLLTTPTEPYLEILLANDTHSKGNRSQQPEEVKNSSQDESFLSLTPPTESEKFGARADESEEVLAGSFTGGSTSHSSYEWRSSTNYRGSETEDPFSSSSRRSSSKWENFTVYRKYDEEMMFFDRISAQKLSETESLRSIQIHPRSISQRIAHRLATRNKEVEKGPNPFQELEAAYVAQICLTWEALNWNYKNLRGMKESQGEEDSGCPAYIAQQFQQFQVLLQRFIETEPFERGRRPEVYARMRLSSPKLLQVPEFQGTVAGHRPVGPTCGQSLVDSEADRSNGDKDAKISLAEFLIVMEDAIRTFMNFLKADKKKPCQILRALLKKKQSSVDPTLLHLIKKANKRKKKKLKDLRRSRKCIRKRTWKADEEMEILTALIDLEVVSRVLRTSDITEEQLHWCEEKMSKVRVWEGKLHRDSTPLFFPSH
ncbi:uncharacterized protein LOC131235457 isoform X2 [Magnolia sinica]|uniref:uncharacterized protein LOC131235457 isoform X2 n=1 Tax=Magnolia sinica TaxID=86752 RepID=UPI00265A5874|nr:uncharacterized protein LOC131235457 isoform X2 [Magnolia sinica]